MIRRRLLICLPVLTLLCVLIPGTLLSGDTEPAPKYRVSFSERFRMVSWDNAISLDDRSAGGSSFTRHRTSLMGQWFPHSDLEYALKLTNEFRYYFVPEDRDFNLDEIFVDQLYFKWNNHALLPGTLTLGRQNIMLGEGFLMFDGGPLVGSRSAYFNAARYDWKLQSNQTLTLFYCYQEQTDDWLPRIHNQDAVLIEQPEEGFGAYYIGSIDQTNLQGYYIRKNVKSTDSRPMESSINTLGGRASRPLCEKLSITGEIAYQFGSSGDFDRSAFGGYLHADYKTGWPVFLPQVFVAGGFYLSGDDIATDDNEGWDPMFARWPKWGESYLYTLIREGGVAYWSNLASVWGRIQFDPTSDVRLTLDYHHMIAPEESLYVVALEGSGKIRGELFIGKLTYRVNKHVSGHIVWEGLLPGSYYGDGADGYSWLRTEVMVKM